MSKDSELPAHVTPEYQAALIEEREAYLARIRLFDRKGETAARAPREELADRVRQCEEEGHLAPVDTPTPAANARRTGGAKETRPE